MELKFYNLNQINEKFENALAIHPFLFLTEGDCIEIRNMQNKSLFKDKIPHRNIYRHEEMIYLVDKTRVTIFVVSFHKVYKMMKNYDKDVTKILFVKGNEVILYEDKTVHVNGNCYENEFLNIFADKTHLFLVKNKTLLRVPIKNLDRFDPFPNYEVISLPDQDIIQIFYNDFFVIITDKEFIFLKWDGTSYSVPNFIAVEKDDLYYCEFIDGFILITNNKTDEFIYFDTLKCKQHFLEDELLGLYLKQADDGSFKNVNGLCVDRKHVYLLADSYLSIFGTQEEKEIDAVDEINITTITDIKEIEDIKDIKDENKDLLEPVKNDEESLESNLAKGKIIESDKNNHSNMLKSFDSEIFSNPLIGMKNNNSKPDQNQELPDFSSLNIKDFPSNKMLNEFKKESTKIAADKMPETDSKLKTYPFNNPKANEFIPHDSLKFPSEKIPILNTKNESIATHNNPFNLDLSMKKNENFTNIQPGSQFIFTDKGLPDLNTKQYDFSASKNAASKITKDKSYITQLDASLQENINEYQREYNQVKKNLIYDFDALIKDFESLNPLEDKFKVINYSDSSLNFLLQNVYKKIIQVNNGTFVYDIEYKVGLLERYLKDIELKDYSESINYIDNFINNIGNEGFYLPYNFIKDINEGIKMLSLKKDDENIENLFKALNVNPVKIEDSSHATAKYENLTNNLSNQSVKNSNSENVLISKIPEPSNFTFSKNFDNNVFQATQYSNNTTNNHFNSNKTHAQDFSFPQYSQSNQFKNDQLNNIGQNTMNDQPNNIGQNTMNTANPFVSDSSLPQLFNLTNKNQQKSPNSNSSADNSNQDEPKSAFSKLANQKKKFF